MNKGVKQLVKSKCIKKSKTLSSPHQHILPFKISFKLLTLYFLVILTFTIIFVIFSTQMTNSITGSVVTHTKNISEAGTQISETSLNEQAEKYLKFVAETKTQEVENLLINIKEDITSLPLLYDSPESLKDFYQNHQSKIHLRTDSAPKVGDTFPFEKNIELTESLPTFKRISFINNQGFQTLLLENGKISYTHKYVGDEESFTKGSKLKKGEIIPLTKKYEIWDCTERTSTIIGEPLYQNQECPDKELIKTDAANWKRFTDGHITYITPVYKNSQFKGIIKTDVNYLPIMKIVNDIQIGKTGYAFMQQSIIGTKEYENGEGITIAHPSHHFVLAMDPASLYKLGAPGLDDLRTLTQKQQTGGKGIGRYVFRGVDKYTAYSSFKEGNIIWSIAITSPVKEFTAPAHTIKENSENQISAFITNVDKIKYNSYKTSFLTIAFVLIFIFLISALFLNFTIVNPLTKLNEATKKVGRGNLNFDLNIKSHDEIGQVAFSFKKMAKDIKNSKKKLDNYNKLLEKKVKQRTKEIEKAKNELEKFTKFAVGRELKMAELKNKLKEMKK